MIHFNLLAYGRNTDFLFHFNFACNYDGIQNLPIFSSCPGVPQPPAAAIPASPPNPLPAAVEA